MSPVSQTLLQRLGLGLDLTEGRELAERVRLVLHHIRSSQLQTLLLMLVMLWALTNETNATALKLWCVCLLLTNLASGLHARSALAKGVDRQLTRIVVWQLMGLNALSATIWGLLVWVTLDTTSTVQTIFVISVITAVGGSSMSSLSPVLPLYIAFLGIILALTAFKIWALGDTTYQALAVGAVLYVAILLGHARNSAMAARASIDLRFQNVDLIARLQQEGERARAAELDATQANQAKSKFLAAASHDLRQPIHALGLFLEVLGNTQLSTNQSAVLANARTATQASSEMLDTLLDISRIEAGVVQAQPHAFALQPLLHEIEAELAVHADAKALVYRTRETDAVAMSDPVLVKLILRNLVSNAIRYTERGGVLVAVRRRAAGLTLEVWDTGIGIAQDQQREVFQEFHQLGNPERDRHKGLGLGLAIAQGLARVLGQRLSLASQPGRGSVFRLTLAVAVDDFVDRSVDIAVDSVGATPQGHSINTGGRNVATPVPASNADHGQLDGADLDADHADIAGTTALRVLVIDDDLSVREGMLALLRDWGHTCDGAPSIEEALAIARAQPPDLVISDYRLREQRTGAEAIAALRAELGSALPALLITGDTSPERLREALSSGVPLLHKPVPPRQLRGMMALVMAEGRG